MAKRFSRQKLIALMETGYAGTCKQIHEELGGHKSAVSSACTQLSDRGILRRVPDTKPTIYEMNSESNAKQRTIRTQKEAQFKYEISSMNGETTLTFQSPVAISITPESEKIVVEAAN